MAKLYFKYGAMGSSKTAQALITRFNYIEMGMRVWLIKPSRDTRDGDNIVKSRIGLSAEAYVIRPDDDILLIYNRDFKGKTDVIIADEAQFFSPEQIDQMHEISTWEDIPVLCFGLRTDFMMHVFPGSLRLFELAESITEIKTICQCGSKATVNVRFSPDSKVETEGEQVVLGGNETYRARCYKCMQTLIRKQNKR